MRVRLSLRVARGGRDSRSRFSAPLYAALFVQPISCFSALSRWAASKMRRFPKFRARVCTSTARSIPRPLAK